MGCELVISFFLKGIFITFPFYFSITFLLSITSGNLHLKLSNIFIYKGKIWKFKPQSVPPFPFCKITTYCYRKIPRHTELSETRYTKLTPFDQKFQIYFDKNQQFLIDQSENDPVKKLKFQTWQFCMIFQIFLLSNFFFENVDQRKKDPVELNQMNPLIFTKMRKFP